ncbi:transposase [Streptomyces poonensis]|uniref:Insertion element IS402-like domain-containing protein n=1 Tax=Streptomyces poonensis TaxID=68255 RepID=A0A918Q382_9ACTN|nr:transposase [Streptomyces poonensis]GGZ30354.1 hypothetical protein GCM10010365_58590 [Streptomyces poonensis]
MIEPVFAAWRTRRTGPGTVARVHDLRELVNAVLYVNRTGIPWEYLPHDFPPYRTVYDYHAKWEADGTTQQVHGLLRDKIRRAHGRSPQPTAAVIDAQSVQTSSIGKAARRSRRPARFSRTSRSHWLRTAGSRTRVCWRTPGSGRVGRG